MYSLRAFVRFWPNNFLFQAVAAAAAAAAAASAAGGFTLHVSLSESSLKLPASEFESFTISLFISSDKHFL